ncbi:hypothetical protein SHANETTE_16 [Bacillus phage Shanette]|uniref:Uncharacterized protein n=1 Tax=Bacillus phage Shanette TaxID=1296656 RepID=S5MN07_9CAUD|nr:hypothetical protein AVV46_gp016 [Bacillus phage Shanette]AGR47125.1 hypothetical protein SHANETTE_16 [Bacillus phage Shanette]
MKQDTLRNLIQEKVIAEINKLIENEWLYASDCSQEDIDVIVALTLEEIAEHTIPKRVGYHLNTGWYTEDDKYL